MLLMLHNKMIHAKLLMLHTEMIDVKFLSMIGAGHCSRVKDIDPIMPIFGSVIPCNSSDAPFHEIS